MVGIVDTVAIHERGSGGSAILVYVSVNLGSPGESHRGTSAAFVNLLRIAALILKQLILASVSSVRCRRVSPRKFELLLGAEHATECTAASLNFLSVSLFW